jgi:hypothetical protein
MVVHSFFQIHKTSNLGQLLQTAIAFQISALIHILAAPYPYLATPVFAKWAAKFSAFLLFEKMVYSAAKNIITQFNKLHSGLTRCTGYLWVIFAFTWLIPGEIYQIMWMYWI